MISIPAMIDVPLHTDEYGVIRVGKTRVTLITIVQSYRAGDTPESIHEGFPTVPLTEIYAVIAYYLAHQAEVDQYIDQILTEAAQWQQDYEANNPQAAAANARLRAALAEKRKKDQA